MSKVTIRTATANDFKAVQDLNHELFLSDNKHLNDLYTDWPYQEIGESYFKQRIAGKGGICFVAELDNAIAGYVIGCWSHLPAAAYKGKRAEVENICVTANARSQGIGAKLIEALYGWAKGEGADYVMVDAYTANTGAINFYKKVGFEPYSTVLWHKLT